MNGSDLLADYRNTGSEGAFSELVRRYTNLVYSIAKRRLSNGALAEEVTQTVFTRLAKAIPKVNDDAELVAWLHRTTVHVAIDVWRSETRRRTREQHAAAMEPAPADPSQLWDEVAPNLDEALNQLNDSDRQAVLLRYFDRKPMRDIGRVLGVSEDAAKMRLSRAIDRLRTQLKLRGVTCATDVLAGLLAERSVEAAPSQLVASLSAAKFGASAATTMGAFSLLLTVMSKAKLTSALVALVAVCIGVIAIRRGINSGAPLNDNSIAAGETRDTGQPASPRYLPAAKRAARNTVPAEMTRSPDAAELEDLKRELRALLQKPPASNGYPPPELRRVLERFSVQIDEALPILLEALDVQDYETRAWALSGVQYALGMQRRIPGSEERYQQMFALARPALGKILRSGDEPDMLRMIALSSCLPPAILVNGVPSKDVPLAAAAAEDLLATLRLNTDSTGFGFMIVDQLAQRFAFRSDNVETFRAAMQPLLEDPQPDRRLLAAYALASWPGEKPTAVKDVLLRELKARVALHSYRAASGLGKLGAIAADAVPELLAYAEATKAWGNEVYKHALEAACRLEPELRLQYPAVDAKLKQEEAVSQGSGIRTVEALSTKLADPEQGPALRDAFIDGINHSPEPEKYAESLLIRLKQALAQAPQDQRAAIHSTIDAVRDAVRQEVNSRQPEESETRPLLLANLTLDARLLLLDRNNANQAKLERILGEFEEQYIRNVADARVTPERYLTLSVAIRGIDPAFHGQWRKSILKNYPWLDRVLPREKE